jgi:ribosomal protein S18 acetylase RimI-like enzyme
MVQLSPATNAPLKTCSIHALDASSHQSSVDVLSQSFQDDPGMCWMFPDPQHRAIKLRQMFHWFVTEHLQGGLVLGSPSGEVCTLWWTPGHVHPPAIPSIPEIWQAMQVFGLALWRADILNRYILKHLPPGEDWFYLRCAGVPQNLRGRGFGKAGIMAGIAQANQRGLPTCLETSRPENVVIYEKLGFQTRATWQLPLNGPRYWTMTRAADV